MASDISLQPLTTATRPIVEQLWQLYRHDLSEFRGTHGPSGFRGALPDEDGTFHGRTLVPFFEVDADRAVHLFYSGAHPVGFAFVSQLTAEVRLMSEFFVVRGLRGHGVARAAVDELFALYPGKWEIPFQENNVAAAQFWRRVATSIAGDNFREERRPVPDKPDIPPDIWITIVVG